MRSSSAVRGSRIAGRRYTTRTCRSASAEAATLRAWQRTASLSRQWLLGRLSLMRAWGLSYSRSLRKGQASPWRTASVGSAQHEEAASAGPLQCTKQRLQPAQVDQHSSMRMLWRHCKQHSHSCACAPSLRSSQGSQASSRGCHLHLQRAQLLQALHAAYAGCLACMPRRR